MKRGIYFLLILFIFISLSSFVLNFISKDYYEPEIFCLNKIDFSIKSVCVINDKIKINIEDKNTNIPFFKVNFVDINSSYIMRSGLGTLKNKEFLITINKKIEKIEIFPGIYSNGKEIFCTDYQEYQNIVSCDKTCEDGTLFNKCSRNKPNYCDNGKLKNNCVLCNCDAGLYCNKDVCSKCKETWICSEWVCLNGKQKRDCFDVNKCKTNFNKPMIEENC